MQSGTITVNAAHGLFQDFEVKMKSMMNSLLDEKLAELLPPSANNSANSSSSSIASSSNGYTHCYGGRMWDVPKDFVFPSKTTRSKGWRL